MAKSVSSFTTLILLVPQRKVIFVFVWLFPFLRLETFYDRKTFKEFLVSENETRKIQEIASNELQELL